MSFECQYCQKKFKSEKTIMVHVCEPKRRYMNKDEDAQFFITVHGGTYCNGR